MTTRSSCTMIDAVMYGMMPSAKIESLRSAPPENRFTSEYRPDVSWFAFRQVWTLPKSTNGAGMKDPRRNRAMMPSVKKIFRRRSGVRKIRPTALNNAASCFRKSQSGGRSPGHPTELLDGWLLDGTTSGDDLLLGRAGDLVDRNDQLNRNVPVAENLDLFVLANGSLGDEVRDGDVTAGRVQLGELLQVHDLVLDPERVLEAAQLRRTHVQRKLTTLEARA